MARVETLIHGLPDVLLGLVDGLVEEIEAAIELSLSLGLEEAKRLTLEEDLVFRHEYINAFEKTQTATGGSIANNHPGADAIEFGRRPGAAAPPFREIRAWVEGKLGVPPDESYAVTATVINNMTARGIPPKRILARTGDFMAETVVNELADLDVSRTVFNRMNRRRK